MSIAVRALSPLQGRSSTRKQALLLESCRVLRANLVCSPFLPSAPILPGPTGLIIREIFRRTSKQKRTIQRLCGEQLGFFDPSRRAASVSLLRARFNLDLAQSKRLARDVVLDLLLDAQLLAVPPV